MVIVSFSGGILFPIYPERPKAIATNSPFYFSIMLLTLEIGSYGLDVEAALAIVSSSEGIISGRSGAVSHRPLYYDALSSLMFLAQQSMTSKPTSSATARWHENVGGIG